MLVKYMIHYGHHFIKDVLKNVMKDRIIFQQ